MKPLTAAMALIAALVSCQKETPQDDTRHDIVRICAETSAPQVVKTNIEPDLSITWSETGEVTKLVELSYTQSGSGVQSIDSNPEYSTSQDLKTASFSYDIEKQEATSYRFAIAYPASAYSEADAGYKMMRMIVPSEQTPSETSSDPDASIVSWASEEVDSYPESVNAALKHIVAYGKMTIKNCPAAADEKVSSVTFQAKGKEIAGELDWKMESGKITPGDNTYNTIKIRTDNIDCSSDFTLWFSCIPFTLEAESSITISVITDKNTYSRDITLSSQMDFIEGHISSFGVDMGEAKTKAKKYVKLTAEPSDWSGTYLIVIESVKKAFTGIASYGSWGLTGAVTISNDKTIESTDVIDSYAVTVEKGNSGYTVKVAGGNYMNWTGKLFSLGTTAVEYSLAMDSSNNVLLNYGTYYLKYNGSGGLRGYGISAMTSIQLYRQDGGGGEEEEEEEGGGGGEEEEEEEEEEKGDLFQKSWLSGYEIPSTNVTLEEGDVVNYNGRYCHSTVSETHGSTKICVYNTSSSTQRIVTHTFSYNNKVQRTYTMLFDKDKKCALWCAFAMNGDSFPDNGVSRNDSWGYDPAIDESWQPDLSKAYNGNYSRGHQVASEDRQTSKEQNKQTFYYSNMTPQVQTLNGGTWNTLEQQVQKLGLSCTGKDTLYVVTGPIFQGSYKTTTDRSGAVCAVPTHYYKCTMKCSFNTSGTMTSATGQGYLFDHDGTNAPRQTVPIDTIEEMTGFDLFANLPDDLETAAEQ